MRPRKAWAHFSFSGVFESEAPDVSVLLTLKKLVAIQAVDIRIRDLERDRRQIPARMNEIDSSLNKLRSEIGEQKNLLQEAEMARQMGESDLKSEKEKVKKWDVRLNDIKSNRDYQALSREIEAARKANLGLEDEILRRMQEIEDIRKNIAQKEEELSGVEKGLLAERSELERKLSIINASMDKEESIRNEAKRDADPEWFNQYEAVRKRRDGVAVVPVLNEHCWGCHMGIPPQLYNLVLRGEEIKTCPFCTRILYFEAAVCEPGEPPPAP
jgi:uncharacterized protein